MNDRTVPTQFAESCFEADRDVQQIADADGVLDLSRVSGR
jgi:hypothetical protein